MDTKFMKRAIELAGEAACEGEVPVGAVVEKDGVIIGEGRNRRQDCRRVTDHAEMQAITQASAYLKDWRLDGCTLYVTLEPCPMCAGTIIMSRISTLVFGAYDRRAGSVDSVVNLFSYPFESRPAVLGGVCEEQCAALLTDFFKAVRGHEA